MDPAQQKAFMQKLVANPALAQQAQALLGPQILQLLQQQQNQNIQKSSSSNALGSLAASNLTVKKETPAPASAQTPATPAQRANEARRRLRQHLDQQLLQIPHPKPVVNEINFIPNPTNEFCYLVGLDLVVQRVLKDKNVFKKYDENPYVCEECGTDFTPSWKAIGQDENDLHLYCETCVRQAQKKKMKADHAAVFKKAFAKIAEQEKVMFGLLRSVFTFDFRNWRSKFLLGNSTKLSYLLPHQLRNLLPHQPPLSRPLVVLVTCLI